MRMFLALTCTIFILGADKVYSAEDLDRQPFFERVSLDISKSIDVGGCVGPAISDLPDIRFELDSAALSLSAYEQIEQIGRIMRRYPGDTFVIEGHADASHTHAYNLNLSKRRAQSVGAALSFTTLGWKVPTRGYGEDRLLYPNDPYHAHNRRVTVVRLSPNSVIQNAVAAADEGRHLLSAHLRKAIPGNDSSYILDAEVEALQTGDFFFACISASRSGLLHVENKAPGAKHFESVGTWFIPAETIVRAPSTGTFQMRGDAGIETLKLIHVACDSPGKPCEEFFAATGRYERIRLGRAEPEAFPASITKTEIDCQQTGTACLTLTVRHEP